jgi:hypothetical protein
LFVEANRLLVHHLGHGNNHAGEGCRINTIMRMIIAAPIAAKISQIRTRSITKIVGSPDSFMRSNFTLGRERGSNLLSAVTTLPILWMVA